MLRFHARNFVAAIANIERAESALHFDNFAEMEGYKPDADSTAKARNAVADLQRVLVALPITPTVKDQAKRLADSLNEEELRNIGQRRIAVVLIGELKLNVISDLSSHLCLMIKDDAREMWEQSAPLFGSEVADRFPDAKRDIAAAGRCLALDESTAGVFHLMRVLEFGLRDLADRVGHTFPKPVEYQEWGVVIEHIEARIKDMVNALPKRTTVKAETAEFYARAAKQFWHFKDAWRNHVMHSRATYDPREAQQVYDAVRDLMQQLAANP